MYNFLKYLFLSISLVFIVGCGGSGGYTVLDSLELNNVPTALATATPSTSLEGEAITFDASSSTDSDGTIVSYEWKNGSTVLSTAFGFTRTDLVAGSHTITLTVTDNDGETAEANVTVTVTVTVAVAVIVPQLTGQLKKTGQTRSYDAMGNEVTDGSLKDDGFYEKGIVPSYSRDDTRDIITDHVTNLQWADDVNVSNPNMKKKWLSTVNYDICRGRNRQTQDSSKCTDTSGDTATRYCTNLTLGGHSDWRLPSIDELMYIVDRSKINPAIDSIFQNVLSGNYWSSTTVVGNERYAWYVFFRNGGGDWDFKSDSNYVCCVRDGQ